MRRILMTGLAAAVVGCILYWLKEKFLRPRVPRWTDPILFGVVFGLGGACGGWIGEAFGWKTPSPQVPVIVGATLAGALIGFGLWQRDRRELEKGPNQ